MHTFVHVIIVVAMECKWNANGMHIIHSTSTKQKDKSRPMHLTFLLSLFDFVSSSFYRFVSFRFVDEDQQEINSNSII